MSSGVDNIMVVPTCRRKSTSIDDHRFDPAVGTIVYINGSIMMSRGLMGALRPQALMCAAPHAVMKGNLIGAVAYRCSGGTSVGMK